MQILPCISLVSPSISYQVPWVDFYAHPVTLGRVLSFAHMIWCRDQTWYCAGFPLIIYMMHKHMNGSSCRSMHGIYLTNRKLRSKYWWMASWHLCFAFRDDWFAYWLNVELNSLGSQWLPWLSLIFPLSQKIPRPCLAHAKGLRLPSSCHLLFPQMMGATVV